MVRAPSFTTKWRTPTWLKHGKLKTKTFIVIYTRTQPSYFEKGFQWISSINLYANIYIYMFIIIYIFQNTFSVLTTISMDFGICWVPRYTTGIPWAAGAGAQGRTCLEASANYGDPLLLFFGIEYGKMVRPPGPPHTMKVSWMHLDVPCENYLDLLYGTNLQRLENTSLACAFFQWMPSSLNAAPAVQRRPAASNLAVW